MSIINLINSGYKYPGASQWVFRNFSMAVERGEVVRITGRNGSGKTTLLKVISGLLELSEGQLQKNHGVKVAYMDQFSGEMLARDLTISEQLKAAAAPGNPTTTASVENLGQFGLGLQDRLDEFIGHLSGGQRQIVSLLCTLASGAVVLCLDEFTSSMDQRSVLVADSLLAHARVSANVSLVLVSHSSMTIKIDRELDIPAS